MQSQRRDKVMENMSILKEMWKFLGSLLSAFGTSLILVWILMYIIIIVCPRSEPQKSIRLYKNELFYAYNKNENMLAKVYFEFIGIVFCILFYLLISYLILKNWTYFEGYLKNLGEIESILLAFTGIVVTVIIFSNSLAPKKYYLTITRSEILKMCHIPEVYFGIVFLIFFSIVSFYILKSEGTSPKVNPFVFTFFLIDAWILVLINLYILWIIGNITFSNIKHEMKPIEKLYKIFWDNNTLSCTKKTRQAVYVNLSYLLKKYINLPFIKKSQLDEYKIIFQEGKNLEKECYKSYLYLFYFGGIIATIFFIIGFLINRNIKWLFFNIFILLLVIVWLTLPQVKETNKEYLITFWLSKEGFLVIRDNKKYYISDFQGFPLYNLYRKDVMYIRYVNNIMALYCIVTQCFQKEQTDIIKQSIIDMISFLKDSKDEGIKINNYIYYLPVFVSSFYYYINCCETIDQFPKEVMELFDSLNLTSDEKNDYKEMLSSFLYVAGKYRTIEGKRKLENVNSKQDYYKIYIDEFNYWKLLNGELRDYTEQSQIILPETLGK